MRFFTMIGASVMLAALSTASVAETEAEPAAAANPFFAEWTTPFAAPPFDRIEPAHYLPALERGIAEHNAEIARITSARSRANFRNTIEALERSGELLTRTAGVYYNLTSSDLTPQMAELQTAAEPLLARHASEVALNQALFARVHDVYERRARLRLNPEQARLLERIHTQFVRNGALLEDAQRTRLAAIDERLSTLSTQFQQNMLADTAAWTMELQEADLEGLPDSVRDGAAQAGRQLDRPGAYLITLQRSSVEPFLTYSPRRDLRERAFRAWALRGDNNNEYDNKAIIREILELRNERARLLGYPTWAHYQIADRMAETPERARELMMRVWAPAVARMAEDRVELQRMMDEDMGASRTPLEAWDWRYYAERVRLARYNVSETEIRPYLQLENMLQAIFYTANRLWGVTFAPAPNVPVYHPDVRAFEVKDARGRVLGLYYFDPYARPVKGSGAWMNEFRTQRRLGGDVRPIIVNCLNLSKAAEGRPTLMSWDDAETLFHEFGHAMHGLLSNVTYATLAGTNVARDYVEFPSQVFEHWLSTDEILQRFARHAETGQPMPEELITRIRNAETFNKGWETVEFLASGLVDMDMHLMESVPDDFDINAFEREALERLGMPRDIIMRHRPPHFAHIFANDYSAGYYGYLWAEVLEEDAWQSFVETGDVFNQERARAFCRYIFCAGNLRPAAEAFALFRGRGPEVAPLLRSRGFPVGDGAAAGGAH